MKRRGVAMAFAVACLALAGCTANDADESEVDVLANVLEREGPEADDDLGGDDARPSTTRPETDASEVEEADAGDTTDEVDEVDGDGEDGSSAASGGAAAGTDTSSGTSGPVTGDAPSGGETDRPRAEPATPAPAPSTRPAPAEQPRPEPRPTPPAPSPRTLRSGEMVSAGVLSSTDGEWVETSSVVLDRDADPDPFVVDLRVSSEDADARSLTCVPRLVAPDDRGLIVRGEIVVSVLAETADEVTRQPRTRIPIDVELAAGEDLDLPASRPLLVHHGEADTRFSCLAVLTAR